MTKTGSVLVVWAPRLAGIGLALFLSLFAFERFDGRSFTESLPASLIGLAPALIVLATVAAGWRYPFVGAGGFGLLALAYAVMTPGRLDWIAVISGPLAIVAVLFLLSWRSGYRRGAATAGGAR